MYNLSEIYTHGSIFISILNYNITNNFSILSVTKNSKNY